MCLHSLSFALKDGVGRGFKTYVVRSKFDYVFHKYRIDPQLYPASNFSSFVPQGLLDKNWLVSNKNIGWTEDIDNQKAYQLGFHIFTRLEDAVKWWVTESRAFFEVEYKNVVAFGRQAQGDTVIAEGMRVVRQVTDLELKPFNLVNHHTFLPLAEGAT